MSQKSLTKPILTGILLAIFFSLALYIRIAIPFDSVFSGDVIKFSGFDSWYYMRLVDNLVHHFPNVITFDPFTYFPHGLDVFWHPLFTLLLGSVAMVLGGGAPTENIVNLVGVYIPPLLGSLTIIPVFFLGKTLFNRWAGIIAAALLVIMPGEFLHRSILGFTDHHVAEVLSITTALLFLVLALKASRQNDLTLKTFKNHDLKAISKPVIYSLLAGVFLGIYILFWVAGLFFSFLLFCYFIIQFIIDHTTGRSIDYLGFIGTVLFSVTLIVSWPFLSSSDYKIMYYVSLSIAIVTPIVLFILSSAMTNRKINNVFFPAVVIGLGALAVVLGLAVIPSIFVPVIQQFGYFFSTNTIAHSIAEMRPLLFEGGTFSLAVILNQFSLSLFFALIPLGVLLWKMRKDRSPETVLLLCWSIFILIATIVNRRYSYYLAVNIVLLNAYLSWLILRYFGLQVAPTKVPEVLNTQGKKAKLKAKKKVKSSPSNGVLRLALGIFIVLLIMLYPLTGPLPDMGALPAGTVPWLNTIKGAKFISNAWYESLIWMKDNTPDPFDNSNFYYELYNSPKSGEDYPYPDSAYGIMASWESGHMITRIGHRIPISNPHQRGASEAARFFVSGDESEANQLANELKVRYILVDDSTSTTRFHGSTIVFAGMETEHFFERYYTPQGNRLRGDYYFYPEYYESLAVRLYNFDGANVIPQRVTVLSYEDKVFPDGEPYKEVVKLTSFQSYEEALNYKNGKNGDKMRIVGTDPYISPVPLESLKNYSLVYISSDSSVHPEIGRIAKVKIFEYIK
jgi:dolichyl-diphosphooligosaccharide--protein glycosyltransferase